MSWRGLLLPPRRHISVVGLSDGRGTLTDRYSYDAFGNTLSKSGRSENPFGYQGNRYEGAAGLYDFNARAYDPSTGRFASRDPVRGLASETQTLNPYPCGLNNLLRHPDPSGLFPENVGDPSAPSGGDSPLNGRANKLPDTGGAECTHLLANLVIPPRGHDGEDVDVNANIEDAEEHALLTGAAVEPNNLANLGWFTYKVLPYSGLLGTGDWDYKALVDEEKTPDLYEAYADFGNFNFRATAYALGMNEPLMTTGGGVVEFFDALLKRRENPFAERNGGLPYFGDY